MPARTHAPRNRLAYPSRTYDDNNIFHRNLREFPDLERPCLDMRDVGRFECGDFLWG